jgi:hypothetical protein
MPPSPKSSPQRGEEFCFPLSPTAGGILMIIPEASENRRSKLLHSSYNLSLKPNTFHLSPDFSTARRWSAYKQIID